jgi:hypothetical protein
VKLVYINSNTSVVYKLQCQDCPLVYTGQTVRQFQVRYEENALAYKNNYNSLYAKHLINYGNSLAHIENITDIIFTKHKGNTLILLKIACISGNCQGYTNQ